MEDDLLALIIWLVVLVLLVAMIALPIVALVVSIRTRLKLNQSLELPADDQSSKLLADHVQRLTVRVARLEAAIATGNAQPVAAVGQPATHPPPDVAVKPTSPPSRPHQVASAPTMRPPLAATRMDAQKIESIIGGRWLGWAAVALIVFATAFFLKYAFDNRWIGELGRVAIGVAAGITLTTLGYRFHKRKWRVFSQILTGGGIVLLYLSAYASFGLYQLAPQRTAFVYMTILIVEAAGLAVLYNAPAIAVMALLGGFLTPVLLHSDRDQYRELFGYIFALDLATVAFLRRWRGMSALAFAGTHLLFWIWCLDNYERPKLGAVIAFQTAVFLIFLLAHFARRWSKTHVVQFDDVAALMSDPLKFLASLESLSLLVLNPLVFFATVYDLLNPEYHRWMGGFALAMAMLYAGAARLLLGRKTLPRSEFFLMIGVSLLFVTLAIPIQFKANWITIAWAVEGLLILWAGVELRSTALRTVAHGVFGLAVMKLVFDDTPFDHRLMFTPVLNKYFLSSLVVTACLFAGAWVYQRLGEEKRDAARVFQLVLLMIAIGIFWFVLSVEVNTYFAARAETLSSLEDVRRQRWRGQMALSVLWSIYAAVLMAVGFFRRAPAIRWAALTLFALTIVKVMLIDMAVLTQLYRIIAFLVLGLLLLVVAWGYHKVFYSKESPA